MAQKMDIEKKKCVTPEFRVSFPYVFEPRQPKKGGGEPKYQITMLFDKKKSDLTELKRAANNAAIEAWGKDKAKWPKKHKMPFRDGAEKEDIAGYGDKVTFVTASSKKRPGLIDRAKNRIEAEDSDKFYAGCYAQAVLIAFPYDVDGNVGISFALQSVRKLKDGEEFSGRKAAEDEEWGDKYGEDEEESDSEDSDSEDEDEESDMGF